MGRHVVHVHSIARLIEIVIVSETIMMAGIPTTSEHQLVEKLNNNSKLVVCPRSVCIVFYHVRIHCCIRMYVCQYDVHECVM